MPNTYLWHPQAHMPSVADDELVLVRGEGAYVEDDQGRRLLDLAAGLWFANVGHGRVEIADAVREQMARLATFHTFGRTVTEPAREVARRVAGMVPIDDARVFLVSGGSDAIDTAAKLARRYWSATGHPGKHVLVARRTGYHGLHGFGTGLAGIETNRDGFGTVVPDVVLVDPHDAEEVEALLAARGDQIAAFFCEPVVGTGGVHFPRPGYLERVRRACRDADVLFVADEVVTGFGRTGKLFACERFGIEPDILVVAKGLSSGYLPIGAAVAGARVWEPFWNGADAPIFRHGLTYSGHASACAAALANLDILEREQLVSRVASLQSAVVEAMTPLAAHPLVREVRTGFGLLAGVELVDAGVADRAARRALDAGLLLRVIAGSTVQVSPPFVITGSELEQAGKTLASVLDDVDGAGRAGG